MTDKSIYDKNYGRWLTPSGKSLVSVERAAEILLDSGVLPRHIRIDGNDPILDEAVSAFETLYDVNVSAGDEDLDLKPMRRDHSDGDVERLYNVLANSPRFINYPDSEAAIERIEKEFSFFERERYILFLLSLHGLIRRFKEENVIWGVGRGSSCASFILYCMEVHDVDPVAFDIPFKELSKETDE